MSGAESLALEVTGTRRAVGVVAVGLFLLAAALHGRGALAAEKPAFTCVVLGAAGGLAESGLSAFLLAPAGGSDYVALDAGTIVSGLRVAWGRGTLPAPSQVAIKGYLISHPHLDHVAGMVVASTDNGAASIAGLDPTIDALRDHLFNWRIWPNMGSEGDRPLNHYRYVRVQQGEPFRLTGTPMGFEAWPLAHGGVTSTAFLVFSGDDCVAYLGDCGPDAVEQSSRLAALWTRLAPIARAHHLRAIFIEASYPDGRPDGQLFGHLTPAWLLAELKRLATSVGGPHSLQDLPVVVTHIKPTVDDPDLQRKIIEAQLAAHNDLGVRFILPRQGDRLAF